MALAGAGLIASAPLWAFFGAAIKLEDGGPIFYTQERVGLRGRVFDALKFRSMRPDAEAGVGAVQATEHDPRVTKIGRLMRATAMDELPQLWNIFRGDMSFVGPRALRPGEAEGDAGAVRADRGHSRLRLAHRRASRAHRDRADLRAARCSSAAEVPIRRFVRAPSVDGARPAIDLLSFWISFRGTWESRGRKY